MRIKTELAPLFGLMAALAGAPSFAADKTIAVFDPVTIAVEPAQGQAVADLFRDDLTKNGYRVTGRGAMAGEAICADELCAAEKGKALGVNEALILKLSRLDTKILVIAALVDVGSGHVERSDRATALSLDDMESVSQRLVRALVMRVPYADTVTVGTVTQNDSRDPLRERSFFTTGLRISGLAPVGQSYDGVPFLYGAEWVNYYDVRNYSIEATLGMRWSSYSKTATAAEFYSDLGAYYYLNNADFSPFLGAGIGLHSVTAQRRIGFDATTGDPIYAGDSGSGMGAWAGGGVTLLRTADVHLVGVVKYTADFFDINGQPAHGVMAGLAVTYTKKNACCLW